LSYSEIKIENRIESSIFDESNPDLKKELKNIKLLQERKDIIYSGAIGVGYKFNDEWKGDFNYKYTHILRIAYLENNNNNHIFNLNLTYHLNSKIDFYLGGKVMLSQFNAEIPYMYTKYNSGSFHHKYGFANGGITYQF
jgi:predicted porin